jgi:hypothetical protein
MVLDLWPLLKVIRESLRAACHRAAEYPTSAGIDEQPDVWLSPSLVRYHVLKDLGEKGTLPLAADLQGLANNGLIFSTRGANVRVLKSDEGDLPVPGQSFARRAFYQQLPLGLDESDGEPSLNLVLLWDADRDYELIDLSLACPKTGALTRASVEAHWNHPLPLYGEPSVPNIDVDDGVGEQRDANAK